MRDIILKVVCNEHRHVELVVSITQEGTAHDAIVAVEPCSVCLNALESEIDTSTMVKLRINADSCEIKTES
jgi:hypothetical protein